MFCSAALGEIDPAAHNFKVLLRHVISRVIDAIPSKLLDRELGLPPAAEVEELPSEAQQAKHGDQAHSKNKAEKESQAQQAKQATALDGDPEEEEEGRDRLPLFSHKVMTFVQHLLKYKVRTTSQRQISGLINPFPLLLLLYFPLSFLLRMCHRLLMLWFPLLLSMFL